MLSLQLKSGEYLTIGDDIAVQIFKQSGSVFRVEVKAPREVPILRGAVREKGGADRPDGLLTRQPVPAEAQRTERGGVCQAAGVPGRSLGEAGRGAGGHGGRPGPPGRRRRPGGSGGGASGAPLTPGDRALPERNGDHFLGFNRRRAPDEIDTAPSGPASLAR